MEIQQLVYGYNNGHSLLNSSIDLPSEDKSILLELTDWSGVNELNTPTYITGFPLAKSSFYALIRTWYAEEMPRPGCVWSHVLLIHKQFFTELTNIEPIIDLFLKPSLVDKNFEVYNKTIEFNNQFDKHFNLSKFELNESFIKRLILNLYSTNQPIYITPNPNIKSLELLFLKLWWIQPINDRFLFSFCSGASTPRKYLNKEIRLQIVAKERFSPIIEESNKFDSWVNIIYNELYSYNTNYIKYLNNVSDDINQNNKKAISLAQIYELINDGVLNNNSKSFVINLFSSLAKFFPEKTEAKKLKKALLSQNVLVSLKEEAFFLQIILNTDNYSSFDIDDLQLINRFIEIYRSNREDFFELLNSIIKDNINEFGVSILTKCTQLVNENDVTLLTNEYWPLFTIFVRIRPSIFTFNENWTFTNSQYLEIINLILSNDNTNNIDWKFILKIILNKQVSLLPKMIEALQKVEPQYISILLDWYDSKPHWDIDFQWIEVLSNNPDKILDWIELKSIINFQTMILVVKTVNPNSNNVIRRGAALWMPFSSFIANNNFKESIYIHAFLTSLAFKFNDFNALMLLKNSFSIVYNEMANSTLDYKLILMVFDHTKPSYWHDWDKCKKLRNTLADKFNEAGWDTSLLIEIVKNESLAKEISLLCKKRK